MIKNRRQGFTLAETLITLAVIGVVASSAIPTLIKSYEKKEWITKYKSTYSIMSQATRMVAADNGGTLVGAFGSDQDAYERYKKNLKVIKTCEGESESENCFPTIYSAMNGDSPPRPTLLPQPPYTYSLVLANGVAVGFHVYNGDAFVVIDTNGKKGPNVTGKDFHSLLTSFDSKNLINPIYYNKSDATIVRYCPTSLEGGSDSSGKTCGVRILRGNYGETMEVTSERTR